MVVGRIRQYKARQVSLYHLMNRGTHMYCTWRGVAGRSLAGFRRHIRSDIENCEGWLSPSGHSSGGRVLTAEVRGPRFNPGWLLVFHCSLKIFPSLSSCTVVECLLPLFPPPSPPLSPSGAHHRTALLLQMVPLPVGRSLVVTAPAATVNYLDTME